MYRCLYCKLVLIGTASRENFVRTFITSYVSYPEKLNLSTTLPCIVPGPAMERQCSAQVCHICAFEERAETLLGAADKVLKGIPYIPLIGELGAWKWIQSGQSACCAIASNSITGQTHGGTFSSPKDTFTPAFGKLTRLAYATLQANKDRMHIFLCLSIFLAKSSKW